MKRERARKDVAEPPSSRRPTEAGAGLERWSRANPTLPSKSNVLKN